MTFLTFFNIFETLYISFYSFIKVKLLQEIQKILNPYKFYFNKRIYYVLFDFFNSKYTITNDSLYNLIKNHQTFQISFFIPIKISKFRYFLNLLNIPLLTDAGTFIINGNEFIFILTLLHTAGIFFNQIYNDTSAKYDTSAFILSNEGAWWSILYNSFTKQYTLSFSEGFKSIKLKSITKLFHDFKFINKKIIYISKFNHNCNITKEDTFYLTSSYFQLTEIGRSIFNEILNLNISKSIEYFTMLDLKQIIKYLNQIHQYKDVINNFINTAFKNLITIQYIFSHELQFFIKALGTSHLFNHLFKQFLRKTKTNTSSQLHSIIKYDQDHSLIDLSHVLLSNEVFRMTMPSNSLQHISDTIKLEELSSNINVTYTQDSSFLCPIDTTENTNVGRTRFLSFLTRINTQYIFEKREIYSHRVYTFLVQKFLYMDKFKYVKFIHFNNFCNATPIYSTTQTITYNKRYSFAFHLNTCYVYSPFILLVPFIEYTEPIRLIMSVNMQRQSIPLIYKQKPITITNIDSFTIYSLNTVLQSYCEGYIKKMSSNKIYIEDLFNQCIEYTVNKYYILENGRECIYFKNLVWPYEKIYNGQIIANNTNVVDNEFALGTNLSIGYIPWEGYNFEDSIVINKKLITNNTFLTVKILTYNIQFFVEKNSYIEIPRIGKIIYYNDILGYKSKENSKDNSQVTTNILTFEKILNNLTEKENQNEHDFEIKFLDFKNSFNWIFDCFFNYINESITIVILSLMNLQLGTKLANRYGNKGIITKIVSSIDMPFLFSGKSLDLIFNPLGIPSRMNLGQLYEGFFGIIAEKIQKQIRIKSFNDILYKNQSALKTLIDFYNTKKDINFYTGKILLKDGQTGTIFHKSIFYGKSYIFKLMQFVEPKMQGYTTGSKDSFFTLPLEDEHKEHPQRFGEMETWALESYGCSYTLEELFNFKTDNILTFKNNFSTLIHSPRQSRSNIESNRIPTLTEGIKIFISQLKILGLNLLPNKLSLNFYFHE